MEINPQDISVSTYQSGTSWFPRNDGIRVTHTPTGIYAESDESRGQHKNKYFAMIKLKSLLKEETDYCNQMELEF